MENFKFILFSILVIALLGLGGYWAFSTIESGSTHVDSQKQKELTQRNVELEKQVTDLTREIGLLKATQDEQAQNAQAILDTQITNPVTIPTPVKTTVSKYQSLIDELQKLVDNKVFLKNKSQGPSVGTIQKFLNIYNNTSLKVDNDYGASTATAVKSFQNAQVLTVDGETGPSTYLKMISWLKSH